MLDQHPQSTERKENESESELSHLLQYARSTFIIMSSFHSLFLFMDPNTSKNKFSLHN